MELPGVGLCPQGKFSSLNTLSRGGCRISEGANKGIYNGWFAKKNDDWLIQLAPQSQLRGHNMKLFKPHRSTNCLTRSSSFSVRVINNWNSLQQSVIYIILLIYSHTSSGRWWVSIVVVQPTFLCYMPSG